MAEKLNISYSTYQRIENGETNSWATHLEKISSLLEVSFEEIVIDKEKFIQINNEQSTGYFKSDIIINNLSERLIEQYEERIKELKETIAELKSNKQ